MMFGPVMEVLNRVAKSPSITLAASHPLPNVLLLVGLERVTAECEARFVAMLATSTRAKAATIASGKCTPRKLCRASE